MWFHFYFHFYQEVSPCSRGKWGKVMTRGKVTFELTGFNIQMTSFDKEQKLVLLLLDII